MQLSADSWTAAYGHQPFGSTMKPSGWSRHSWTMTGPSQTAPDGTMCGTPWPATLKHGTDFSYRSSSRPRIRTMTNHGRMLFTSTLPAMTRSLFGTRTERRILPVPMPGRLGEWLTIYPCYLQMLTVRSPYIQQAEVNLNTGVVGEWHIIWNGTGGMVCAPPISHDHTQVSV